MLVLSFDGKGVVIRPDGLREATANAATSQKLSTRLSKGEKRNRKRIAEVVAAYDPIPVRRTIADIPPKARTSTGAANQPTEPGWLIGGQWPIER